MSEQAGQGYVLTRVWLTLGFLACAVLFYLCLVPNPPSPELSHFDKVEHFAAYLVLGLWFGGLLAPRYWTVFFGLAVFGAVIEFVQAATSYRSGDAWDLLADALGIVTGIGLARLGGLGWLRYIDARVAANRNRTG